MNDLMTRTEAAEYLKVKPRWLAENWRIGPKFYRLNQRVVRYSKAELDRWLQQKGVAA